MKFVTGYMRQVIEQLHHTFGNDFAADHVEPVEGGFSGANVARVKCPAGTFALRMWPNAALPAERIRGLHRLLQAVFDDGISQIAPPVAGISGATLHRTGSQLWQLEPWRPGQADFHSTPSSGRIAASFACLAGWHRAARSFQASRTEAEWFATQHSAPSPAVRERLQQIQTWDEPSEISRIQRLIPTIHEVHRHAFTRAIEQWHRHSPAITFMLRQAVDTEVELQPCIRDIWHDHLLFEGDQLTGLIDCNACRMESISSDLARLLGSLFADARELRSLAVAAYESHHKVTPNELRLIDVLDRSGTLISSMYWIREFTLQGRSCDDSRPTMAAMSRLDGFVARLENNFGDDKTMLILPK